MKNKVKEQYINIPVWFIKCTSNKKSEYYLTPFQRELYLLIYGLASKEKCYANDQYFANLFNVSIKHINKSIHKLEYLRLITIEHINNKRYLYSDKHLKNSVLFCFKSNGIVNITSENGVYNISKEKLFSEEFVLEEYLKDVI